MIFVFLDGRRVAAESLNVVERQRVIHDLKTKLLAASGLEQAKFRRLLKTINLMNGSDVSAKKASKKAVKEKSIKSQSNGFSNETIGRFGGGQGATSFVGGGAPGLKK
jgi:hypothetical protein